MFNHNFDQNFRVKNGAKRKIPKKKIIWTKFQTKHENLKNQQEIAYIKYLHQNYFTFSGAIFFSFTNMNAKYQSSWEASFVCIGDIQLLFQIEAPIPDFRQNTFRAKFRRNTRFENHFEYSSCCDIVILNTFYLAIHFENM